MPSAPLAGGIEQRCRPSGNLDGRLEALAVVAETEGAARRSSSARQALALACEVTRFRRP
jgi:hypothetical protein